MTPHILYWLDHLGHALRLDRLPFFWRICDAYDRSLGVADTPANFPRRWSRP